MINMAQLSPIPNMAAAEISDPINNSSKSVTNFGWPIRRRISFRRRRLPTIRLGGRKKDVKSRRGSFFTRVFRNEEVKMRSLKHKFVCMVKKIKKYCRSLVKEMIGAGGTINSLQQRMVLDSPFAAPVIGLSFSSHPHLATVNNNNGLGRPLTALQT